MHPAYAETHFQIKEPQGDWPADFAIITAHATTGEKWTAAENDAADEALFSELSQKSQWVRRITGYSPAEAHAEPGWAVNLPFDTACDIGLRYKQDAIYYVKKDTLSVSFCDKRRGSIAVGPFTPRVHTSAGGPVVRPGYAALRTPAAEIKPLIHDHPQFAGFIAGLETHFKKWRKKASVSLRTIQLDCLPKEVIRDLSENLLHHAESQLLIDPYAVYQHLMDYWAATMQDDCYLTSRKWALIKETTHFL